MQVLWKSSYFSLYQNLRRAQISEKSVYLYLLSYRQECFAVHRCSPNSANLLFLYLADKRLQTVLPLKIAAIRRQLPVKILLNVTLHCLNGLFSFHLSLVSMALFLQCTYLYDLLTLTRIVMQPRISSRPYWMYSLLFFGQ